MSNTDDVVQRSQMRASDADRDRIAAILRDAHAEGRLTQDELMERLEATYAARTYLDLDQVVGDLPIARSQGQVARLRSQPVSAPQTGAQPVRQKTRRAARVALSCGWWFWGTGVAINVLVWFLVSVASGPQYPWPIWVAGPWGIILLAGELAYRRGE